MTARKRQAWNYTPDLPLRSAPFLHWPLRPAAVVRHLVKAWRPLTSRVLMLAVSFAVWQWASPSLSEAESLRPGWILEIWVRNIVLVTVVAGGLHLLLQRYRVQGDGLRYDARSLTKNKSLFLFNDQVKDNMFLTLLPAMVAATVWESWAGGPTPTGLSGTGPSATIRCGSWCCWVSSPSGRFSTSGPATGCSIGR